jgi:hypothetical protein
MHLAELAVNWSLNKKGICNRWNRLLVIMAVLGSDTYTVIKDPSPVTSYTTHFGGLAYGYLCGIILFDDLERTWFHTYLGKPAAIFVAVMLPLFGLFDYVSGEFPPEPLFGGDFSKFGRGGAFPCCWQLVRCGLERSGFESAFQCTEEGMQVFTIGRYPVLVETCAEFDEACAMTGAERFAGHS